MTRVSSSEDVVDIRTWMATCGLLLDVTFSSKPVLFLLENNGLFLKDLMMICPKALCLVRSCSFSVLRI